MSFDDSGWQEGHSGFSTTGYSDTEEATYLNQLPPAPLTRSFYLRRKFTVADPQAVKWLVLRLDYTHGFVAYLNGQEVLRHGFKLPGVKVELCSMTWREAEEAFFRNPVVLIPMGSIEQHGPHLPLSVDVVIAEEVCRRVARKLQANALSPGAIDTAPNAAPNAVPTRRRFETVQAAPSAGVYESISDSDSQPADQRRIGGLGKLHRAGFRTTITSGFR